MDSPCGLDSVPPLPSVSTPPSAGHPAPLSIPPMLSPHDEKIPITPLSVDFQPKSVSSVSNQVFSPYPSSAPASQEPSKSGHESNAGTPAPASNTVSIPATTPTTTTTPVPMQTQSSSAYVTLKRPQLSTKDYEANLVEEELMPSKILYDYSCIDAWLYHPVKKFKPIVPKQEPITRINNVTDNPTSPQVYIRRDTSVPILPVIKNYYIVHILYYLLNYIFYA